MLALPGPLPLAVRGNPATLTPRLPTRAAATRSPSPSRSPPTLITPARRPHSQQQQRHASPAPRGTDRRYGSMPDGVAAVQVQPQSGVAVHSQSPKSVAAERAAKGHVLTDDDEGGKVEEEEEEQDERGASDSDSEEEGEEHAVLSDDESAADSDAGENSSTLHSEPSDAEPERESDRSDTEEWGVEVEEARDSEEEEEVEEENDDDQSRHSDDGSDADAAASHRSAAAVSPPLTPMVYTSSEEEEEEPAPEEPAEVAQPEEEQEQDDAFPSSPRLRSPPLSAPLAIDIPGEVDSSGGYIATSSESTPFGYDIGAITAEISVAALLNEMQQQLNVAPVNASTSTYSNHAGGATQQQRQHTVHSAPTSPVHHHRPHTRLQLPSSASATRPSPAHAVGLPPLASDRRDYFVHAYPVSPAPTENTSSRPALPLSQRPPSASRPIKGGPAAARTYARLRVLPFPAPSFTVARRAVNTATAPAVVRRSRQGKARERTHTADAFESSEWNPDGTRKDPWVVFAEKVAGAGAPMHVRDAAAATGATMSPPIRGHLPSPSPPLPCTLPPRSLASALTPGSPVPSAHPATRTGACQPRGEVDATRATGRRMGLQPSAHALVAAKATSGAVDGPGGSATPTPSSLLAPMHTTKSDARVIRVPSASNPASHSYPPSSPTSPNCAGYVFPVYDVAAGSPSKTPTLRSAMAHSVSSYPLVAPPPPPPPAAAALREARPLAPSASVPVLVHQALPRSVEATPSKRARQRLGPLSPSTSPGIGTGTQQQQQQQMADWPTGTVASHTFSDASAAAVSPRTVQQLESALAAAQALQAAQAAKLDLILFASRMIQQGGEDRRHRQRQVHAAAHTRSGARGGEEESKESHRPTSASMRVRAAAGSPGRHSLKSLPQPQPQLQLQPRRRSPHGLRHSRTAPPLPVSSSTAPPPAPPAHAPVGAPAGVGVGGVVMPMFRLRAPVFLPDPAPMPAVQGWASTIMASMGTIGSEKMGQQRFEQQGGRGAGWVQH